MGACIAGASSDMLHNGPSVASMCLYLVGRHWIILWRCKPSRLLRVRKLHALRSLLRVFIFALLDLVTVSLVLLRICMSPPPRRVFHNMERASSVSPVDFGSPGLQAMANKLVSIVNCLPSIPR